MQEINLYHRDQILDVGGMRILGRTLQTSFPVRGREWFVNAGSGADDGTGGNDSNDGRSWDRALRTMDRVLDFLASGDVVYAAGNVKEQIVTPAGVFDVGIVGVGFQPRHADAHTSGGGYRANATWREPASGATAAAMLRVQQQGWRIENFVFQLGSTTTSCVEAYKTDDSGDDERDGGHLALVNCRFQGTGSAGIGFHRSGGNGYCRVIRCTFQSLAEGIGHTAGTGGQDGYHLIEGCFFEGNTKHIVAPLYRSRIHRNTFGLGATVDFDLTGGAGNDWDGNKFLKTSVFENNIAGTDDLMIGRNWSADTGSADVDDTSGVITANPDGS